MPRSADDFSALYTWSGVYDGFAGSLTATDLSTIISYDVFQAARGSNVYNYSLISRGHVQDKMVGLYLNNAGKKLKSKDYDKINNL